MFNNVFAKRAAPKQPEPSCAVGLIKRDLEEPKELPIGRSQFEEWSDRIIRGAMVQAEPESLKFALAAMLLQLDAKDIFKPDYYFIVNLRKSAINQTAQYMMEEIKTAREQRKAEKNGAVTLPNPGVTNEVLRDQKLS